MGRKMFWKKVHMYTTIPENMPSPSHLYKDLYEARRPNRNVQF